MDCVLSSAWSKFLASVLLLGPAIKLLRQPVNETSTAFSSKQLTRFEGCLLSRPHARAQQLVHDPPVYRVDHL